VTPPPRALALLGLVLFLSAGAAFAQTEAAEIAVAFEDPGRAAVRTRIPANHPLAGAASFHVLAPSRDRDWQRSPASFERDPSGALIFGENVQAEVGEWVQIAVPLPDTAPEPGADSAFSVRITPPPGYRIADAFPAVTAGGGEGRTLEAHLPAPPSLLRFRLVSEEGSTIGLVAVVDGALALLLIGLAAFGARRLFARPSPAGTSAP